MRLSNVAVRGLSSDLAKRIAIKIQTKLPQGFIMCYGTGKVLPKFVTSKVAFSRIQYDDYKPAPKKNEDE